MCRTPSEWIGIIVNEFFDESSKKQYNVNPNDAYFIDYSMSADFLENEKYFFTIEDSYFDDGGYGSTAWYIFKIIDHLALQSVLIKFEGVNIGFDGMFWYDPVFVE